MLLKEKTKSVQITEDIHNRAKSFCNKKALKIGRFIEDLITRELNNIENGKR
jgi:hypothetical protein